MVTWKVIPVTYPPNVLEVKRLRCRVCNNAIFTPYEALALMCSEGGIVWTKLKGEISLPVYCCSTLCADMFILSVI